MISFLKPFKSRRPGRGRSARQQGAAHRTAFMRLSFMCLGIFFAALSVPALANNLRDAPDIPLPDQVIEDLERGASFDTAQGRIVTAYAHRPANISSDAIHQFYRDSLPNLGWQVIGDGLQFRRPGEQVIIRVSDDMVIFNLTPIAEKVD